jgi:O-acetyl-ADP-ribose deacetylase (regulator of RNase III)
VTRRLPHDARKRGASDRLQVVLDDLTMMNVDAIVNAANETMLGGGGVDGAIHRWAGRELLEACRAVPEVRPGIRCPTGEARITPGFRLSARYVIHTVGPIWHGGQRREPELLASCYRKSLALAREYGLRSIAFPAISCGAYGFPLERAAKIAVREARAFLARDTTLERVLLVAFDDTVHSALRQAATISSSAKKGSD